VANGQVIALGGFVKTKISESGGQVPILGSIPLLGWLAKNRARSTTKEYLFIFLSPTIIKPRSSPGVELYTKMKLHDATSQVGEAIQTDKTKDPLYNWFFNAEGESYAHKVTDYANARYQPNTVDIQHDPLYRSQMAKKQIKTMHIADEEASPQEYIKKHREAKKRATAGDYPAETLSLPGAKVRAPQQPLPAVPPVMPTREEPITKPKPAMPVAPAPLEEQALGVQPEAVALPQGAFDEPIVPTPAPAPFVEQLPMQQKKALIEMPPAPEAQQLVQDPVAKVAQQQAPQQAAETTMTIEKVEPPSDIDDAIQQRRAQLKKLLSGGSLGQALLGAPVAQEAPVAEAQEETAPPAPVVVQPTQEELMPRPLLSRRSGLKNMLRIPGEQR
ncbi:MAG: hypothetical protein PVJ92_02995, partial [Candidatus Dependentiae bacterium]